MDEQLELYRFIDDNERKNLNEGIRFPDLYDELAELDDTFDYGNPNMYNDPKSRRMYFYLFKEDLEKIKKIDEYEKKKKYVGVYTIPTTLVRDNLGMAFYPDSDYYPFKVAITSKDIKKHIDYYCPDKTISISSMILPEYGDYDKIYKGFKKLSEIEKNPNYQDFMDSVKEIREDLKKLYFYYQDTVKEFYDEDTSVVYEAFTATKEYLDYSKKEEILNKILEYKKITNC